MPRFVETLQCNGIDVWYDQEGLYAGAQWLGVIEKELEARDIFLLVISPESWSSKWAQDELALAFTHHKHIMGVVYKPIEVSGFILTRQMIDVSGQKSQPAAQSVAVLLIRAFDTAAPTQPAIAPAGRFHFQTKARRNRGFIMY